MTTKAVRPKSRPSRRTRHSKDDSDIYAALNDFTDAIEGMPSELVRQFTLLREVDAKYLDLQTKISTEIDTFISSASQIQPQQRGQQLFNITRLLSSALGCADEKVGVASSSADISDKHKLRLDADYEKLESGEISELIRFGPEDHPAFVHGSTMGMSRSESRRLAIAQAKKNEEELQEFRKEQFGRRGQLVASEERARGAAKKKSALIAGGGQQGNGVGVGPGGVGFGGIGTPPRGGTPVAGGGDMRKSHHKKKPPRGDEENPPQKRKHPNQYTFGAAFVGADIRYANANRQGTPGDPPGEIDEEGVGDTSNEGMQGDEVTYCYCNGVSYGEMVACDRKNCAREWFHLECAGLTAPPKGQWYCRDCKKIMDKGRRGGQNKKAKVEGGKTSR